MNQRFKMLDYSIDVDYGTHVLNRLRTRFDMESAWLDYILESIFTDENVADYLINDVRIGEDVIVIDEDSGVSFALNVGTDCFYVKTVFNAYDDSMRIGDMQKVLRFARELGLRVEEFQKKRRTCYA